MKTKSGLLCLMALLVLFTDSSLNAQNWPMINQNKERTSWAAEETILYPPLKQKEVIPVQSTGDYISLSYLTVYEDLLALAVGRYPNILEAVDLISGDTIWTFEVPESVASMNFVCAQNDSMIFVGGQKGLGLYALDRETGELKWSKEIGSLYTRSIVLDSASAYIHGDSLYCISIQDGSTIWSYDIRIQSTPAVDDHYVYVTGGYKVQVFDKNTGELLWWRPSALRSFGVIAVDDDCFYTQSNDTIYAYNKGSWDVKWIYESQGDTIQSEAQNSIAITDSKLCFTVERNGEGNGELHTLNKETGAFLWSHTFSGDYTFAPSIANGVVYIIPLWEAALYGFDLEDGTQLLYDNSLSYTGQAIVANHQLFVASRYEVIVFETDYTDVEDPKDANQNEFVLKQNYPNPFNALTTIEFFLPQPSLVDLKIYNILGEEIYTLVNEDRAPGRHHVDFDGTHLPVGLYFYKMAAGSFVNTKQLLLIK